MMDYPNYRKEDKVIIQKRSDKDHRPQISKETVQRAIDKFAEKLYMRLEQKGYGSWLSRHEILGVITEEALVEVPEAVHHGTLEELREELLDVAVGCVFGVACIDQGTLDW